VHPVLRLLRINNVSVSLLGTLVGGLVAHGHGIEVGVSVLLPLALAAVSTASVTAAGNVLNDLQDQETDRVNHPDRPLVTGAISPAQARWMAGALFLVGAVVVVPLVPTRPFVGIILLVAVGALFAYEFRFKAVGFAGNLLVAFLTGAVFLYGAASVGPTLLVAPLALMAFFATLSREVIKDMEDAGGDVDRHTLPQTRGIPFASAVARGSVAVAILLSPVPVLYLLPPVSIVGIMYLGSVFVADALFVASVAWLPGELHREQTMSKFAMTVALLAFLISAFR
jgi:geranylgeranylglycerol-phosphate geranylgeranyltransferase